MSMLEKAIAIAAEAHAGAVDKAGEPYVFHPLRVMLAQAAEPERIVGVLHDVVEDTPWTLERLRGEGFSEAIVAAVDAVSRRDGEDYFDFVRRAASNPIGKPVKRADLLDNLNANRIPSPGPKDHERLERYRKALAILDAME